VIVLNGTPRSGKTTLAAVLVSQLAGPWVNVGVDLMNAATPKRLLPGMGLRPGGERPDLEPFVVAAFEAMYAAVRAFSLAGVGVAVDVGHHDRYSRPLGTLAASARQLVELPVLFVGVRCSIDDLLARRKATWDDEPDLGTIDRIRTWEEAVHRPGIYDVEVDTSLMSAEAGARLIERQLTEGPATAFATAARMGQT